MTEPVPLHVATDEDLKEGAVPDRRESAWRDPRTWLAFAGLLLTLGMALLGYIASQLADISSSVQTTRDLVLTVTTQHSAEIKALEDRLLKMENAMETQQKAYNFNFTSRLAVVEAKVGTKSKNVDEE